MKRYEFDQDKTYRLTAVTDLEGRDKGHSHDFYEDRMNCIATQFQYDERPFYDDYYRLSMCFVQNEAGEPIHRSLHTSVVREVNETEKGIEIHTNNSIYVFESAQLNDYVYQDVADLIELYFSLDDDDYFGRGFYYDSQKRPHELRKYLHVGMFQDSVLLNFTPDDFFPRTACRYFPMWNSVEFYDTLYHQQDYSTPMLIHNTGKENLPIRFQLYPHVWTIKPGESKRIIPFDPEGADPDETGVGVE